MTRRVLTAGALLLGVLLVILFFTTEWMASRPPADESVADSAPPVPSKRPEPRVAGKPAPSETPKPSTAPEGQFQVIVNVPGEERIEERHSVTELPASDPAVVVVERALAMLLKGVRANDFVDERLRMVVQTNAPVSLLALHPKTPSLVAAATCLVESPGKSKTGNDVFIMDGETGKVFKKMSVLDYGQASIEANPQEEAAPLPKAGYSGSWSRFWKIKSLAFSPFEDLLAIGTLDGYLILWNYKSSDPPTRLTGFSHGVETVAFSNTGRIAIAGGQDDGSLRLAIKENFHWRLDDSFSMPRPLAVAYWKSDDILRIAAFSGFWTQDSPTAAPALKKSLALDERTVCWSMASGAGILAGGKPGEIKVIGLVSGKLYETISGREPENFPNGIVCLDSGGEMLAFGAGVKGPKKLVLKEVQESKTTTLMKLDQDFEVTSVAFSSEGSTLASGHQNGSILIWKIGDGLSK